MPPQTDPYIDTTTPAPVCMKDASPQNGTTRDSKKEVCVLARGSLRGFKQRLKTSQGEVHALGQRRRKTHEPPTWNLQSTLETGTSACLHVPRYQQVQV